MDLPSVFTGSLAVGALQATLERHLATFSLDPVQVRTVTTVGNFGGVNLTLIREEWKELHYIHRAVVIVILVTFYLYLIPVLTIPMSPCRWE